LFNALRKKEFPQQGEGPSSNSGVEELKSTNEQGNQSTEIREEEKAQARKPLAKDVENDINKIYGKIWF